MTRNTISKITIGVGIYLCFYAINMDTSVPTSPSINDLNNPHYVPERVNNIGLMHQQQNYLLVAGFMVISGIVLYINSKSKKLEHKFQAHEEAGKKAEFLENYREAINQYLSALYHLENDYDKISKQEDQKRKARIILLNEKIQELKKKSPDSDFPKENS